MPIVTGELEPAKAGGCHEVALGFSVRAELAHHNKEQLPIKKLGSQLFSVTTRKAGFEYSLCKKKTGYTRDEMDLH